LFPPVRETGPAFVFSVIGRLGDRSGKWGKFAGRGTGALNFGVIQPVHGELGR
jgi:hypothetical protein